MPIHVMGNGKLSKGFGYPKGLMGFRKSRLGAYFFMIFIQPPDS